MGKVSTVIEASEERPEAPKHKDGHVRMGGTGCDQARANRRELKARRRRLIWCIGFIDRALAWGGLPVKEFTTRARGEG